MLLKSKVLFSVLVILNLIFCAHAAPAPKPVESDENMQNAVLYYINAYRQQHGLSKLTMNHHIVIQAKQHSKDMATHHMAFSHQDFNKRIAKLRQQIKNIGGGAENIAYNYKNAQEVVSQWVRSPGHKRNIVGNYNLTGIGIARDTKGRLYYTQIFLQTQKNSKKYSSRRTYVKFNPFFSFRSS